MSVELSYFLCPIRYLRMFLELAWFNLLGKWRKKLSAVSYVPETWKKGWDNVRENDEQPMWSSIAFSGKIPSLPPYTRGWLIISDRGVYFLCKRQGVVKLLFRRGRPPLWKWHKGNLLAEGVFMFDEGEEWRVFIPGGEDLFRARLFHFELREN
ncbi:MAG: hypothetical protein ACP5TY_06345 [Thermodesulforhabdaceae bacterium]